MYLESIFIGGDIRAQLPEEAKKFDNIDKTFKKVHTHSYIHISFVAKLPNVVNQFQLLTVSDPIPKWFVCQLHR